MLTGRGGVCLGGCTKLQASGLGGFELRSLWSTPICTEVPETASGDAPGAAELLPEHLVNCFLNSNSCSWYQWEVLWAQSITGAPKTSSHLKLS